jgi:hypothetical protein
MCGMGWDEADVVGRVHVISIRSSHFACSRGAVVVIEDCVIREVIALYVRSSSWE